MDYRLRTLLAPTRVSVIVLFAAGISIVFGLHLSAVLDTVIILAVTGGAAVTLLASARSRERRWVALPQQIRRGLDVLGEAPLRGAARRCCVKARFHSYTSGVKQIWTGRMTQAVGKYGESVPTAAVCCNACRACLTTNVIGLATAGVMAAGYGVARFARRLIPPS